MNTKRLICSLLIAGTTLIFNTAKAAEPMGLTGTVGVTYTFGINKHHRNIHLNAGLNLGNAKTALRSSPHAAINLGMPVLGYEWSKQQHAKTWFLSGMPMHAQYTLHAGENTEKTQKKSPWKHFKSLSPWGKVKYTGTLLFALGGTALIVSNPHSSGFGDIGDIHFDFSPRPQRCNPDSITADATCPDGENDTDQTVDNQTGTDADGGLLGGIG